MTSSSFWLFQNYKKIHSKFENFPSVILDITLTNILFLKNPKQNPGLSIDQVIKAHSKYLLVNRNVWSTYVDELKRLYLEKRISQEDYSRLITKNQFTSSFLLNSTPDAISQDSVLSVLEEIKSTEVDKDKELLKYSEISKRLNLENLKLHEENKNREDVIKYLQKEVEILKTHKSLQEFREEEKEFNTKMGEFISEKIKEEFKQFSSNRLYYSIFLSISLLVFAFNGYLLSRSVASENKNFIVISVIVGLILFIIPFIRSFFKHDKVLEAFRVAFLKKSRIRKKEELTEKYRIEYEKDHQRPILR